MEALTDKILLTQVCQECFRYLSVGTIALNRRGETICGRCNISGDDSMASLFNVLAKGFLFKCINHFNGCNELLSFEQVRKHEESCVFEPQECFFCSFSGNLLQILNHSLKYHPNNVTFDGKILFSLNAKPSKKTKLYVFENNIFLITVNITEELFTILINSQTSNLTPTLNHCEVKFFKSREPSDCDFMFGFCQDNLSNYFEKTISELITFFGNKSIVCCQIQIGQFSVERREIEIQKKYSQVRHEVEELVRLKTKLDIEKQELCEKSEYVDLAKDVVKTISRYLFKCISCRNIYPTEMSFCPELHSYCKNCLKSHCESCQATVEFKRLPALETFVLQCDFPQCNKSFNIHNYLIHRPVCLSRPYKCPLKYCNAVLLSANKLIEHWHCDRPRLLQESILIFENYECEELYWLLKSNLYHVHVGFDKQWIQILIEDVDVLSNEDLFKCDACNSSSSFAASPVVSAVACDDYSEWNQRHLDYDNGNFHFRGLRNKQKKVGTDTWNKLENNSKLYGRFQINLQNDRYTKLKLYV